MTYLEKIIDNERNLRVFWRLPPQAIGHYLDTHFIDPRLATLIREALEPPHTLAGLGLILNISAEILVPQDSLGVRARGLPTTKLGWLKEYQFYQAVGRERLNYEVPRGAFALVHPIREHPFLHEPLGPPDYYGLRIPPADMPRHADDIHAALLLFLLYGDSYRRGPLIKADALAQVEKSTAEAR